MEQTETTLIDIYAVYSELMSNHNNNGKGWNDLKYSKCWTLNPWVQGSNPWRPTKFRRVHTGHRTNSPDHCFSCFKPPPYSAIPRQNQSSLWHKRPWPCWDVYLHPATDSLSYLVALDNDQQLIGWCGLRHFPMALYHWDSSHTNDGSILGYPLEALFTGSALSLNPAKLTREEHEDKKWKRDRVKGSGRDELRWLVSGKGH